MDLDTSHLAGLLSNLDSKVTEVLVRYPDDKRMALLKDTLNHLTRAAESHYLLIAAEADEQVRIRVSDYHEILEAYLPALRMFTAIPKSYPNSVYELGVVCTFDEVLVHHAEGQK